MNEVVKIGSYEDDDNYGSEKTSKHHSSAAPFKVSSFPARAFGKSTWIPSKPKV